MSLKLKPGSLRRPMPKPPTPPRKPARLNSRIAGFQGRKRMKPARSRG